MFFAWKIPMSENAPSSCFWTPPSSLHLFQKLVLIRKRKTTALLPPLKESLRKYPTTRLHKSSSASVSTSCIKGSRLRSWTRQMQCSRLWLKRLAAVDCPLDSAEINGRRPEKLKGILLRINESFLWRNFHSIYLQWGHASLDDSCVNCLFPFYHVLILERTMSCIITRIQNLIQWLWVWMHGLLQLWLLAHQLQPISCEKSPNLYQPVPFNNTLVIKDTTIPNSFLFYSGCLVFI